MMFFMLSPVSNGSLKFAMLVFPENEKSKVANTCPQDFCADCPLRQVSCCSPLAVPGASLHGLAEGLLTLHGRYFTGIAPS